MSQATRRSVLLGICAAAALLGGCAGMGASMGGTKERVVIQVSDGDPKVWNLALNVVDNVKVNYAKRKIDAEIQLVAFGPGIQMLKDDAVVASRVRDAVKKGDAKMVACENSMQRFKLSRSAMLENVTYVDAGVIHIVERQREGWAVIRP
jgi:intracellular sulfur oxidation DsrE/DsrF family protein